MNKFNYTLFILLSISIHSLFANEDCCGEELNKGVVNTLDKEAFLNKDKQAQLTNPAPATIIPLKALLIAGGCCHDYALQTKILSEGIQQRANIRVDVTWTRDQGHNPSMPIFKNPDWAKGYDLIIHDECAALKTDEGELANILKVHETIPAVHLHCAVHSFRNSDNNWHEHIGLASDKHGPHLPVAIEIVNKTHPIMKGLSDWVTDKEELYNNSAVYGAEALAMGTQTYKKNGKDVTDKSINIWINQKFGARSFSTSMGHFTHNVEDPRYLELITRGALWACGKIENKTYRQPYKGENTVNEMPFITVLKATALSTQTTEGNLAEYAIDGNMETRWCADSSAVPAWYQIQFITMTSLNGIEIDWEIKDQWTRYNIETSRDGKKWTKEFDASQNTERGTRRDKFTQRYMKYMRINILGQEKNMWPSIREIRFFDYTGTQLTLDNKN